MTGIAASCLVLISMLCINRADSIEFQDSGLTASAQVHIRGVLIDVLLRSDNFSTPDWSVMNIACSENVCIAYYKHCTLLKGNNICQYDFSQPGDVRNTEVEITAASPSEIANAETTVGIMVRWGLITTEIPLNRFDVLSSSTTPPYCGRRQPQSMCWPAPTR